MEATIDGENQEYVKIYVTDTNGVDHEFTIEKASGEIAHYVQDGYPDDPAERTPADHEAVHQATQYAQYYVSTETDHGPFEPHRRIDRLQTARQAIGQLSAAAFEAEFGALYRQVLGNHPDVDPPVARPAELGADDFLLFVVDLYLDEGNLETVSGIHLVYYDDSDRRRERRGSDPFEQRSPDARLELTPNFLPSIEVFQSFLQYHLRCRIRDCYLELGVEPPEQYRVLGRGRHDITRRYVNDAIPTYDRYHDESADIPGYELAFDYGFGALGQAAVESLDQANPDLEGGDVDIRSVFDPTGQSGGGLLDTVAEAIDRDEVSDADSDPDADDQS